MTPLKEVMAYANRIMSAVKEDLAQTKREDNLDAWTWIDEHCAQEGKRCSLLAAVPKVKTQD